MSALSAEQSIPPATPVPQGAPSGFVTHRHEAGFTVPHGVEPVWAWLNDPATFTDSQVPPWRVEFLDTPDGRSGFEEGVLNVHHGPLMNFAGVLTEIDPGRYRDLQYFYGSYAVSLRLIRPTRLQFWVEPADAGTAVSLQVDSLVRSWVVGPWSLVQRVFWRRFAHWLDRSVARTAGGR